MKKFLLFCFLSILMTVSLGTVSAYAQEGTPDSCCFWLENEQPSRPENLYKMETAQPGSTHYYTVHFLNNCEMPLDSRISLDWELLNPNGQPVDGDLRYYADLAFQIFVDGSSVTDFEGGRWVGDNVRTGMGRTSQDDPRPSDFPGFVMNDHANNLGSQDGYFHLTPENQYDFLFLHFLMHASENDFIRVKITWRAYGNYTLIAKLNERAGGTAHENYYLPSTNQNIYYGGKQSRFVREIARFTLETMDYGSDSRSACSGDTIWAGRPAIPFVFNPVIPQPIVDTTFEVFYTTQKCFGTYVDSIVNTRFVVAPRPPKPNAEDVAICGVGTAQLEATSPLDTEYPGEYDVKYNWYAAETDETPIFTGAVYTPTLDTEDTTYYFYVRSFLADGCEGDAEEVAVKVNKQPSVTLTYEENYCPDGTDREITAVPANFYGPVSYAWTGATGNGAAAQVATTDDCGAAYNFSVVITDDATGCTATASGSFTQIDEEAPVINNMRRVVYATETECDEEALPAHYTSYDALVAADFEISDNCSKENDDFTVALQGVSRSVVDCEYVFVRTYTLTDHCGNSVEFNDTVVVVDEIVPTFTTPEVVATLEPVYNGTCELLLPAEVIAWVNTTFAPADNCSDVTITLSKNAGDVVVDGEVITVTFADACGNTATTTFTIDAPEALSVSITADTLENCLGATFALAANVENGTAPYVYAWMTYSTGTVIDDMYAENIVVTPSKEGNKDVIVVVTDTNGCQALATTTILVNALPEFELVGDTVCFGEDAVVVANALSEVGDYSYSFQYNGETLNFVDGAYTFTELPAGVTTLEVTAVDNVTGCESTDNVDIYVNDEITYTTSDLNPTICAGTSYTMSVNTENEYSYKWYYNNQVNNVASTSNQYTRVYPYHNATIPAANYVYNVVITQSQNGIQCQATEQFFLVTNYIPEFQINQGEETIALCLGESVTLEPSREEASYAWSTGATTKSIVVEATTVDTTEYTLTLTTESGCTSEDAIEVVVLPLPEITTQPAADNNSICTGNTAVLTVVAEGATQYQWQILGNEDWEDIQGATDASYTTEPLYADATEAVTYKYRVILYNGLSSIHGGCNVVSAEVEVVANPADVVTIVTDAEAVCDNSSIVLEVSEPDMDLTYQWQIFDGEDWTAIDGETSTSLTYTLEQNTQFRVLAHNEATSCTPTSNTITVDTIARPIAQLLLDGQDADLYFCYRDSVIPSQINCLNSEAFTGHILKFDFIVPDRVEAPGTEQIIIKGVGDFYVGAFILDETTGCSSDTVWHWIYSKGYPEYDFVEVAPFCDGENATMEIVPQEDTYTYTWLSASRDTLLNGLGEAVYTTAVSGTQKFYTIVSAPHAEQDFSCSTIDSIEVTANPLPIFSVLGVDSIEYCNSNELGRIYISDITYNYKLNDVDVALVSDYIQVADSGYHKVTAVNPVTGCEYSVDSVRVDLKRVGFNVQLLIEGVNADYFIPCGTELPDSLAVNVSYTKPADMDCTYSLLTGTLQSPSNQQVIVAEHGVYTLGAYVTNTTSNCVSDTVYHQIIAIPSAPIDVVPDVEICMGDSVELVYPDQTFSAPGFTTSYSWYIPSPFEILGSNQSIVVAPTVTTQYNYRVKNIITLDGHTYECVSNGSVDVTVNPLPTAAVVYNSTCPNAENTFAATSLTGVAPFTYSWNEAEYASDSTFTTINGDCGDAITVALKVKDANGCVSNPIVTEVTSSDTELPVFSPISDLTVYCGDANMLSNIEEWLTAAEDLVSDNCGIINISNNFNRDSLPANSCGNLLVTFSAEDACGNTASTDAYIEVKDTIKPVLSINDLTISCSTVSEDFEAAIDAWAAGVIVETCGNDYTVTDNSSTVVLNTCGTYDVNFTATNACGVSNSITASVTVIDTVRPVLNGEITDRTVYVGAACNYDASSIESVSVTDNCASKLEVVFSDDTLRNVYGADSLIIRTWTSAQDCGGNVAQSIEQRISVVDTIKPEFVPGNSNLEIACDDSDRVLDVEAWLSNIAVTDNCSGYTVTNDFDVANIPTGCDTLDVTFTATDNYGNTTTAVYTIKSIDNQAPVFAAIPELDVDYCATDRDDVIAAWLNGVSATDNCSDFGITNNYTDGMLPASGCGIVSVEFEATDSCGNISTALGTINVVHTATPTVIAEDTTIECGSGLVAALNSWTAGFTATAGCGNSEVTLVVNTDQVKDSCGTYTAVITATDGCGVSGTTNVSVTIDDTTKPVFSASAHSDRQIFINASCVYDSVPFATEITGVITDNCTDGLRATYTDQVITNIYGADSVIIRTWSSEEDCGGNTADASVQELTIIDNNAPVFATLKNDSICKSEVETYVPNADYVLTQISDNCVDAEFLANYLTYEQTATTNNDQFVNDTITYTWTVVDNYGNTATAEQKVIVFALPNVAINGDEMICSDATSTLTATVLNYSDVTYLWNTNETTSSVTVPAGEYSVTATVNVLGCENTANIAVAEYEIPSVEVTLPASICNAATLPISATATQAGDWEFNLSGAIIETITASDDDAPSVTSVGIASVSPVVYVATTYTYAENCTIELEDSVKVGNYPMLIIKQGPDFASAVIDNNDSTIMRTPVSFFVEVAAENPACPPSDDLRVSIDYQFKYEGETLDATNPLTDYLFAPTTPESYYVNFATKKTIGSSYFVYTRNNGVDHYPCNEAEFSGDNRFDYFRFGYIKNREIEITLSGLVVDGNYDIDFQLVTHNIPGTTTPSGAANNGVYDGVLVGGDQFYVNPFESTILAENTMSIFVDDSSAVVPQTSQEGNDSFTHTAFDQDELIAEKAMRVYPNPTTADYINIDFKNVTGKTLVRVLNMNGKVVDQFEVDIYDETFVYRYALDKVAPGVYFINAISNEDSFTKKVIIQNR